MPGPLIGRDEALERGRHREDIPAGPAADDAVALTLPGWDLLPPAEFLDRHPRRR